jgi:hypothetical protein
MTVRVSLSQTGRFDGPESGALWYVLQENHSMHSRLEFKLFTGPRRGLPEDEEVLVRPPQTSMRFPDFVDLLHIAAQPEAAAFLPETFYLEYLSVTQYLGPELAAMIPMPKPAEDSGLEHLLTNFWMGKGESLRGAHRFIGCKAGC